LNIIICEHSGNGFSQIFCIFVALYDKMTDTMLSFNNRWVRLAKDLLFVALGVWLVSRGGFFSIAIGLLALYWYGRDAWFQSKTLWQEKNFVPKSQRAEGPTTAQPQEDGKITITDLRDAKEVNFEKE